MATRFPGNLLITVLKGKLGLLEQMNQRRHWVYIHSETEQKDEISRTNTTHFVNELSQGVWGIIWLDKAFSFTLLNRFALASSCLVQLPVNAVFLAKPALYVNVEVYLEISLRSHKLNIPLNYVLIEQFSGLEGICVVNVQIAVFTAFGIRIKQYLLVPELTEFKWYFVHILGLLYYCSIVLDSIVQVQVKLGVFFVGELHFDIHSVYREFIFIVTDVKHIQFNKFLLTHKFS